MLSNLPGRIGEQEVEEMIGTVDRNRDGRISYSEFRWDGGIFKSLSCPVCRVMMGGFPLVISNKTGKKLIKK